MELATTGARIRERGARRGRAAKALLFAVLCTALPAAADTTDEKLSDLVEILRQQGVIDDAQYAEMSEKAAAKEKEESWTDRFSIWADFRARYENFLFHRDAFSKAAEAADPTARLKNRHRVRYRARINLRGEVNSRAAVYFRLASGGDDPRSTNQTLGSGVDFDTDQIRFDLAYATLTPYPDGELPGIQDGYLGVDVGKVKNPYVWKRLAEDKLLWDNDITLEGGNLRVRGGSGPLQLFLNGGVYVIDENSKTKDPLLAAGQLGGDLELAEHVSAGLRGTIFSFNSLDDSFFARGAGATGTNSTGGNIPDGLSRSNGSIEVIETSAFLAFDAWELFPIEIYGTYANNLSARSSLTFPGVGQEDTAYDFGVRVGNKKQLVQLSAAYYYVEANAFPSMYIDSDVLDGFTNRKAYVLSAARQLLDGVEFVFWTSLSHRIQGGVPFAVSGLGANRVRMQADLKFKL